jgi:hypothetical protein
VQVALDTPSLNLILLFNNEKQGEARCEITCVLHQIIYISMFFIFVSLFALTDEIVILDVCHVALIVKRLLRISR